MAITDKHRLNAVLHKLNTIEGEIYGIKRIVEYIQQGAVDQSILGRTEDRARQITREALEVLGEPTGTGDREGLYDGQLDYQITDKPSYRDSEECDT